jgi:hypothetical protein
MRGAAEAAPFAAKPMMSVHGPPRQMLRCKRMSACWLTADRI